MLVLSKTSVKATFHGESGWKPRRSWWLGKYLSVHKIMGHNRITPPSKHVTAYRGLFFVWNNSNLWNRRQCTSGLWHHLALLRLSSFRWECGLVPRSNFCPGWLETRGGVWLLRWWSGYGGSRSLLLAERRGTSGGGGRGGLTRMLILFWSWWRWRLHLKRWNCLQWFPYGQKKQQIVSLIKKANNRSNKIVTVAIAVAKVV